MSNSRITAVLGGLVSAFVLKWTFDQWLWDRSFQRLAHVVEFETAESIAAVLSYLLPLAAAAWMYAVLSPHSSRDEDDRPALRKHPWQSPRLIVGLLVIIAATVAGLSYGRVFGLPSVTLPQAG